jgi:hypothetical protein
VAHQVQVNFINDNNDGLTGDGNDRNVYVSSISLNGTTIQGENFTSNNASLGSTNPTAAVMLANGTVTYNVPVASTAGTGTGSTGTGTGGTGTTSTGTGLTLQVSGDMYQGDPNIQVFVDGQQVGGTFDITAHHSLGQTQTIQIAGNFDPTVAHQVQVNFINDNNDGLTGDGNDRNVYVSSISLNGTTIQGENFTSNNASLGSTNPTAAVMLADGTVTYNVPIASTAGSTGTGAGGTGTTGTGGTGTGTGGTGTGTTGSSSGRDWAFFANEGGEPANWTSVNSGWSAQPIDGLATQTDIGDGFWFGSGLQWSPTPHALMMNDQYGTPGHNYIDMGQAATGAYDATWLSWLKADAASATAPITVVRIWQEINGDWMPWSVNETGATSIDGTPAGAAWSASTIIAAFQHMAEQVRIALPNAKIEWNLNAGGPWSGPSGPGNGTGLDLYPGDAYVDVIGIDAYEKSISWANTVSGSGVNLNNLVAFAIAHNKEVGISETAAHNDDGSYMTSMANYFDGLGTRAAYISYYDQGLANNGDNIIYSATGTDSAPAVRAALNASSFGTKPYDGSL